MVCLRHFQHPSSTSLGVRTLLSYTIKQGFSLPRNPCGSSKRLVAACAWHAACGSGSLAHMYHLPSVSYRQLTSELSQVEDRYFALRLKKRNRKCALGVLLPITAFFAYFSQPPTFFCEITSTHKDEALRRCLRCPGRHRLG